jgi:hypothetical protein
MSGVGGWSAAQLAEWGVRWPPQKGWREALRQRWLAAHPGWRSALSAEPVFGWEDAGAAALEDAVREERAAWESEVVGDREP